MKLSAYQSELKKIITQRNGYLVLATGSLGLCLLLTSLIFILLGREKVILVPPSLNKEVWVTSTHASSDYLSKMALFFSELALNVTADNVDFQQSLLLQYVDPGFYGTLKTQLVTGADRIKQQHLSTAFFPVDIKVDSDHLEAVITGDLKTFVGETALPSRRVSYHLGFKMHAYRPLIQSFDEVGHA